MGNWVDHRQPALLAPLENARVQPYRPPPRDTSTVRVRARQRAFLLDSVRVEPLEWIAVPLWLANELRQARGEDIEVEVR
jgi:hypothetical protein